MPKDATELVDLVEQLANAVWPRKDDVDRMIRSIRGKPEPSEVNAGRRPRRPWMRDTVQYDPSRKKGDRYVKVSSRKRPMTPTEAYDRITALPISVLVDMLVDAVRAPDQPTDLELHRSPTPAMVNAIIELSRMKARLAEMFENEAKRFNPDGSEQHRSRFFKRLIGIAEHELGVDQAARKAAARRRRMPSPQARARQQQREGIAVWAYENTIRENDAALPLPEAMASLLSWWRANVDDAPAPSAKLVADTIGNSKKTGKCHVVTFVGLTLRA